MPLVQPRAIKSEFLRLGGQWGRGWGLRTPGHGLQNIFINEHFKVSRDGNQMWDRAVGGRARSRDTKGEGWG